MKLKYKMYFAKVAGDWIAFPEKEDRSKKWMLRLNETGMVILKNLETETTVEAIVNAMAAESGNSREELREFVLSVIQTLRNKELIDE